MILTLVKGREHSMAQEHKHKFGPDLRGIGNCIVSFEPGIFESSRSLSPGPTLVLSSRTIPTKMYCPTGSSSLGHLVLSSSQEIRENPSPWNPSHVYMIPTEQLD